MSNLTTAAMAVAVISAFLLAIGGVRMLSASATRKHGILMLVAAAVLLMNVMIWTV
ncbi:MAG: hypothetical protein ABIO29_07295 [Sphingomicrobium sp.]